MTAPFIIFGLPRSRTYWLSHFLSHGAWTCWHEQFPRMRTLDDIRAWVSQNYTGCAETTAAPMWRTILSFRPDIRSVIVRRSADEVVDSLMRLDMGDVCTFDRAKLLREMSRLDHKLDQIEARMPNVLSVQYGDLVSEATCAKVFEHCLQLPHDSARWATLDARNLQFSMQAQMRYMFANSEAIAKLSATVRRAELVNARPKRPFSRDDITIQPESCESWFRDGTKLFEEHSIQLGDAPDDYRKRNWNQMMIADRIGGMLIMTARCNGKMVGYYACYVARATNDASLVSALNISIFVSKNFAGIGTRLRRASEEALAARGVGEICLRAGVVGDGPRLGAIYERDGAEYIGKMYRLPLKRAA